MKIHSQPKYAFIVIVILIVSIISKYDSNAQTLPWTYTNTGENHIILISTGVITISGNQIEVGDYIGVFYEDNGTYYCGGYVEWNGVSPNTCTAWRDDPISSDKDGFSNGESFTWRIWKATNNLVIDMAATYVTSGFPNQGIYVGYGMSSLSNLTGNYPVIPFAANGVVNDILCFGEATGSIDVSVVGGTYFYSYLWSNGTTNQDLINIPAGNYDVTVTDGIFTLPWNFVNTGSNHTMLLPYGSVLLNNDSLNTGDYLGAFFIDGADTLCGGYTQWIGGSGSNAVPVWGDDPGTTNKDGFSISEPFNWRVWKVSNGSIIDMSATYLAGFPDSGTYVHNGMSGINYMTGNYILPTIPTIPLSFTVNQSNELIISINSNNISIIGNSDGFIDLTLTGGNPPFSFMWSNGETTEDLLNIPAGNYSYLITDSNSCEFIDIICITQPVDINVVAVNPICGNSCDGTIDLIVIGGIQPYSFNWSNGNTSQNIDSLCLGSYAVTISDSSIPPFDTIITSAITGSPVIDIFAQISNYNGYGVSLPGLSDGYINLDVTGGIPPYTFLWSNNETTEDLANIAAGVYTITITDSVLCFVTETFIISQELDIASNVVNSSCFSSCDGQIELNVTGGIPPISFIWSNGQTSSGINNACADNYSVTITDSLGSNLIMNFSITEPSEIVVTSQQSDYNGFGTSGSGVSDGWINLSVNGGSYPFSYAWSNGATTQDISNLFAGNYNITITDSLLCQYFETFTLTTLPYSPTLTAAGVVDSILCYGDCNGSIDLTVSSGNPWYTYLWNDGATIEDRTNLCAGYYTVFVTDNAGIVTQPFSWTSTYNPGNHIIAIPGGTIIVNGISPEPGDVVGAFYENNGALECGGYFEYNGSTIIVTAMADDSMTPNIKEGFATGEAINWKLWRSADSIVVNMTAIYNANEVNQGTFAIGGISAISSLVGSYNSSGIQQNVVVGFDLTGPDALDLSSFVFHINTAWMIWGKIYAYPSGGTPPYNYLWSTSETTSIIMNLSDTGFYSLTVTDAHLCEIIDSFYVAYDSIPAITQTNNIQNVYCNGNSSGEILLNSSGGVPPYSYQWSNGEISNEIIGLAAGIYYVTIYDQIDSVMFDFEVEEPDLLIVSETITNVDPLDPFSGAISVSVTGGTSWYYIQWSNGEYNNVLSGLAEIDSLCIGLYSVDVIDYNGCLVTNIYNVEYSYIPDTILINGNASNILCNLSCDGEIDIAVLGGISPYSFSWSSGDFTEDVTNLCPGNYEVTIMDALNGYGLMPWNYSETSIDLEIHNINIQINGSWFENGDVLGVFYENGGDLECGGYYNGAFTIGYVEAFKDDPLTSIKDGFYEGDSIYFKLWRISDGNIIDLDMSNYIGSGFNGTFVSGGIYTGITLEGSYTPIFTNYTASFTITEPPPILISAILSDYGGFGVSSYGASDGSIDITVSGGTPPYSYLWSGGITTEDLQSISAGLYELQITDANLCDTILEFEIMNPPPDQIAVTANITDVSCFGQCNGILDIMATGGIPPLNYIWSNGETTAIMDNLCAGQYLLTISDIDSSLVVSYEITEPDSLAAEFVISPVDPVSFLGGSIDATITGGTLPYSFLWSDGSTEEDILTANYGNYLLIVTDSLSCESSFDAFVDFSILPPWDLNPTIITHNINIPVNAELLINGVSISVNDFLGVFYDSSGVESCGGYGVWQGQSIDVTAYGDNSSTTDIEGFVVGEELLWKFWDASENLVHDAVAVYSSGYPDQQYFNISGSSGIDSVYTSSISGTVLIITKSNLNVGMVVLYEQTPDGYYAVAKGLVTNGNYHIEGLKTGNYICYAIPQPGNDWGIPGYYTTRDDWQGASWVYVNANTTGIDITLDPVIPYSTGVGVISGNIWVGDDASYNPDIFDDNWFSLTKSESGIPARNIPILLYDSLQNAMDFRLTGESGEFVYDDLEFGTYFVKVEKAGLEADYIEIVLSSDNPTNDDMSFILNDDEVVAIKQIESGFDIRVFPNPANSTLNVVIPKNYGNLTSVDIFSQLGVKQRFSLSDPAELGGIMQISLDDLATGVYIMRLCSDKNISVVKFIKQ